MGCSVYNVINAGVAYIIYCKGTAVVMITIMMMMMMVVVVVVVTV